MFSTEFILYVANQEKSKLFYEQLLGLSPSLHVPGMTEFNLSDNCKLGLMPENGIVKILENKTPHPNTGNGIPRCELYLKVEQAVDYLNRGITLGATTISPFSQRDWGDKVGYISDLDGHIIAFAE
ncbi:MAG: VOC family protein [Flavobacteriales bacterium]